GDGVAPLAAAVDVDVFGERFISAYTKGDNREVVATDTMKNFVYAMAAEYTGRTLLGLCAFFGRKLLATYPVMEALQVSARELPLRRPSRRGRRGTRAAGSARAEGRDRADLPRLQQPVDPAPRPRDRYATPRGAPAARRNRIRGREPHA